MNTIEVSKDSFIFIFTQFSNNPFLQYYYNPTNGKFVYIDSILSNIFFTEEQKETILLSFCKAQQIYRAFCRFAFLYKYKKAVTQVSYDLALNPIDTNKNNHIVLLENNFKYLFTINDIINLIETAITHSPCFFVDPIYPKNPYNNTQISRAALYNIYFKMKNSYRVMSTLFHLFFLCDFNIKKFALEHESMIRSHAIKEYVFKSHAVTLYLPIIDMLESNSYTDLLEIHDDFPKDQLADVFREYLYLSFIIDYGKDTLKSEMYKKILNKKLRLFYEENPTFGRKMFHMKYIQCPETGKLKQTQLWEFNNVNKCKNKKILDYDD